jgi:hypothetical protein
LFRVSFYTETRIVNISWWSSNTYHLTENPRDRLTFTFTLSRGTFPIDYLVFHKREILVDLYNKKAYIDKDPRYFVKSPTYEEWYEKIHRPPSSCTVTYQEQLTTGEDDYEFFNIRSYGNRPYTRKSESFEGHTRTAKKQKTVFYTRAIFDVFKIQQEVLKRAPTWIFDSAFDTTLNPYLHVSIHYFLISNWSELA